MYKRLMNTGSLTADEPAAQPYARRFSAPTSLIDCGLSRRSQVDLRVARRPPVSEPVAVVAVAHLVADS
jgi:hypothetical protein